MMISNGNYVIMSNIRGRWNHRWLNPKAEARPSRIQGTGVFAKEAIGKDETIAVLGGLIVPITEIQQYREIVGHAGLQIDDNFFIVPETREEVERFGSFNHSCEPNSGMGSSITVIAMRDIAAGEECVSDYALSGSSYSYDGFDCHCSAASCRNHVEPEDWKRKDIQEKFLPYFSPYLRRKIDQPR